MTIYKALPEPLHKSSWLNRRSVFFVVFAFVFSATLSYLFTRNPSDTSATLVGFSAGNIINDYTMGNYNTMTEAQIQAFLDSKDACSQKGQDYYNYLVNYYNVQKGYSTRTHSWHFENGHFVCLAQEKFGENEGEFGSGETAAHIIWQAAQDYHINPQVLLVTLQKEQTLLNDPIPRSGQYNSAMGFGCFDDNQGCRDKYAGFKKQIRSAAALYHEVLSGGWSNFTVGVNYIQYNTTDSGCGGSKVNIENLATAALYRYTPYQPNAATIAAGTGTAYCGAYGNRNFYNYFTEWFGSTQTHAPIDEQINVEPAKSDISFIYSAHVQEIGWQKNRQAGYPIGTVEQSARLEAFKITLSDTTAGNIVYRAHIQDIGWENTWRQGGEISGTSNEAKRLEAIQIQLVGQLSERYDIYYRVHVQDIGWMNWAKNGEPAGTTGESKRIEAIQVTIIKKNSEEAPSTSTGTTFQSASTSVDRYVTASYIAHVQDYGWLSVVTNGRLAGTTGESKRIEAIRITLDDPSLANINLTYRVHVQDIGWMDWVKNGELAGTTGESKRLEAIEIKLDEKIAKQYDLTYRVHVQDIGWMDWVKNGELAGTTGESKRLEAIEIKLTKK